MTDTTRIDIDLTKLRAPFPAAQVGKLPKITCGACSKAQTRNCERHSKSECGTCHNWITTAHMHLDYVGHAAVTDRLLEVDPYWVWEPMAITEAGLPIVDGAGGLWIRLTVGSVTRTGYGHADGKTGGDAVKIAIGDALRNAAMRFGVALDLWSKEDLAGGSNPDEPDASPGGPGPTAVPDNRDWVGEVRQLKSSQKVMDLGTEAAKAGALVGQTKRAFTEHLNKLKAAEAEAAAAESAA